MAKTNSHLKNLPVKDAPLDAEAQALLEEVDAEVKAEQLQKFFTKHSTLIVGVICAVVLGTAIGSTSMNMHIQQQEKDSEQLITLLDRDLDKSTPDEVKATIADLGAMSKDGSGEGHRVAARLGQAGSYFKEGKQEEGIKALQELAADTSVKPLYRDYGRLLAIRARMDKDDAQGLLTELSPLVDINNPWHLSAQESAAVLYAKLGQKDRAVDMLNKILIDPDASSAIVERAKLLARIYKN